MTAKIYRGLVSMLLLLAVGKAVSLGAPEEVVLAKEADVEYSEVSSPEQETSEVDISDVPLPGEEEKIDSKVEDKQETSSEIEATKEEDSNQAVEDEIIEGQGDVDYQEVEEEVIDNSNNEAQPVDDYAGPQARKLYILNQEISYENGGMSQGQSIIDADPSRVSTWGGAAVQSGDDGLSTHFIGHNPGVFNCLFSLVVGSEIKVTDDNAVLTTYVVQQILVSDDYGYCVKTGNDKWDLITSAGNGEAICLQTCIDDCTNLIVFATKI